MKSNLARKVNLREGGLGDITKPRDQWKDPNHWGDTICGRIDPNFIWDPKRDKLAKDMPMPKELKAILRKSYWWPSGGRKGDGGYKGHLVPTKTPKVELASTPESTVAEIRTAAMNGQVVSLHHLAIAQQRERQAEPPKPQKQTQPDTNMDLQRSTDVLRSELGLKVNRDVPKIEVRTAPKPQAVSAEPRPRHPKRQRPEITGTDLVDGRKFGKWIVTLRRRQDKRACQHIGKRLLVIAGRNVGRGQIFYLAAAYGVLESR